MSGNHWYPQFAALTDGWALGVQPEPWRVERKASFCRAFCVAEPFFAAQLLETNGTERSIPMDFAMHHNRLRVFLGWFSSWVLMISIAIVRVNWISIACPHAVSWVSPKPAISPRNTAPCDPFPQCPLPEVPPIKNRFIYRFTMIHIDSIDSPGPRLIDSKLAKLY